METWRQYGGISKTDNTNKITVSAIVTDNLIERQALAGEFRIRGTLIVEQSIFGLENLSINNHAQFLEDISVNNIGQLNKLALGNNNSHYFTANNYGVSLNHNNATSVLDLKGDNNVLKVSSTSNKVTNILADIEHPTGNKGVMLGSNKIDDINYETYLTFYNGLNFNSSNNEYSINDYDMRILYSTLNNSLRINAKEIEFTDLNHRVYEYQVYNRRDIYTGFNLKLVSSYDDNSNTFAKITSKLGKGLVLGGGASPNDITKDYGFIGTIDSNNNMFPALIAERSDRNYSKKIHLGLNTYAPKRGDYLLDINGKVTIGYGEVNWVNTGNIEPKKIIFHPKNRDMQDRKPYMIVTGSPNNTTSPFNYSLSYSLNGGKDWSSNDINTANNQSLEIDASVFTISNYLEENFRSTGDGIQFLASNNNTFFYANSFAGIESGRGWNYFTVANADNTTTGFKPGNDYVDVVVLSYPGSSNRYRVIFTAEYKDINNSYVNATTGNRYQESFFVDFTTQQTSDIRNNNLTTYLNVDDLLATPFSGYPNNLKHTIVDNIGNVWGVGSGIVKLNSITAGMEIILINTGEDDTNVGAYAYNTNYNYHKIYSYDENYIVAVGENIISVTKNGGKTWDDINLNLIGITDVTLKGIYILDENNVMAVGNKGTFLYSVDSAITWQKVPDGLLDGSGTGRVIYEEVNELEEIYIEDTSSMVIIRKTNNYVPETTGGTLSSPGEFMVHYLTIPYLFNYTSVSVLDICGNSMYTGNITIDTGDILTTNKTMNIINDTAEVLNLGGNLDTVNIGKSTDTITNLEGSIKINNSMGVGKTFDNELPSGFNIDVSGNIQQQGYVYQF